MSRKYSLSDEFEIIDPPVPKVHREEWALLQRPGQSRVSPPGLRHSLVRGIPEHMRPGLWQMFGANVSERQYLQLSNFTGADREINKDLSRTFPFHSLFTQKGGIGQTALQNLLRAYAKADPKVGYCQGMAFIAGLLLMHLSELAAFRVFWYVMNDLQWRELFLAGTPKLVRILDSLARQVESHHLDLYMHFQSQELDFTCFSAYFLTLCVYIAPLEVSVKIMDLFLMEGEEVLLNLILKMLVLKKTKILRLKSGELHNFLSKRLVVECFEQYKAESLLEFGSDFCQIEEEYEMI